MPLAQAPALACRSEFSQFPRCSGTTHLLGFLEALLQLGLLLLHFALPLLYLLQLDLVLLQLLQLGLVFVPLHLQGFQLLLQVSHLSAQVLFLLRRSGEQLHPTGQLTGPGIKWYMPADPCSVRFPGSMKSVTGRTTGKRLWPQ